MNPTLTQRNSFLRLISYCSLSKIQILLASLYSVLNKICDIVPEILIGIAIDVIVNKNHSMVATIGIQDPIQQLYAVGFLTAVLWICESVFEYLYLIKWRSISQETQHTLRLKTYDTIQHLDLAYFENKKQGTLLNILNDDINQLEHFLSQGPNEIIQLTVNIIVMGAIFFYICPAIALWTLLPIPFVIGIAYYYQKKLGELYGTVREQAGRLAGHIAQRLNGIITIKSYTTETYELAKLEAESTLYKKANRNAGTVNAKYIPVVRMAIMAGFIMTLIVGGLYALSGKLPINWYASLIFLTQRFLWPFTTVSTITDLYEKSRASATRIVEILETENHIKSGAQRLPIQSIQGSLMFHEVGFAYNNSTSLFDKLTFSIPAKKTIAFVGSTGSGKSTIIKLLERFYDPHHGSIKLDEHSIQSLDLNDLRNCISLVSQDTYLIDGTIAENIAYGSFERSRAEIIEAAKMAHAHTFIMGLSSGYDTNVEENGKNLSGGQKQRIAIARAIIKKAPILIFDEATSAIDNETEHAIQQSLNTLRAQHTIVIIAHRLSTVRNANIIYVLDKGQLVETGTHDTLLENNGYYATLWHAQFQQ